MRGVIAGSQMLFSAHVAKRIICILQHGLAPGLPTGTVFSSLLFYFLRLIPHRKRP